MLNGKFRSYFGALCVPILDKGDGSISNVTHDWANATASLGGGLAVTLMRLNVKNQRVDLAKQRLAELALANNVDYLLFLDDDVVPPPDALMKMIELWRSDPKYQIISGMYWSKSEPSVPLIFDEGLVGSKWDWKVTDLIQADAGGAGLLFVDANVFRKMPKPWFSCNYFFDDPRGDLDLQKWGLSDELSAELLKGAEADPVKVQNLEKGLASIGEQYKHIGEGKLDPNWFKNRKADNSTTEDLYFFKKAKDVLGIRPWFDCSIQAMHQDKRTGKTFGISPDMPQAKPRYQGKMTRDNKIVLDLGSGQANYWIQEGTPIKVDLDPKNEPDVVADVRFLNMFEDCFADMVFSSHTLEHISFHETVSTLKEWVRVLKVGGKLAVIVPNLKWAATRILNPNVGTEEAERAMFMHYSAQKGDLKEAYTDVHRAGFTPEAMRGLLARIPGLDQIEVYTSGGNIGNWSDEHLLQHDDLGYNIVAFARKTRHDMPVSLKLPINDQESINNLIGDKAKEVKLNVKTVSSISSDTQSVDTQAEKAKVVKKGKKLK